MSQAKNAALHPECPCCGWNTHAPVAATGLGCHRPGCYEFSCRDLAPLLTALDEQWLERGLELAESIDRQNPGAMSDAELADVVLYELAEITEQ